MGKSSKRHSYVLDVEEHIIIDSREISDIIVTL